MGAQKVNGKTPPSISSSELIELFMHWDTRVSQQETLYVSISVGPIAFLATAWKDADAWIVSILALASLSAYIFHLLTIRRFSVFQDNIFSEFRNNRFCDWDAIVVDKKRRIGIRNLRLVGLLVLMVIWSIAFFDKAYLGGLALLIQWSVGFVIITIPLLVAFYLWRNSE